MKPTLQPDPTSYKDRRTESADLHERIDERISSVIAISGARGAGKSSLAIRTLATQERDHKAFTLLVPSPSRYEAHDLLLSLFQRICERVEELLAQRLGSHTDLLKRGKRAAVRRIARTVAVFFIVYLAVALPMIWLTQNPTAYLLRETHASLRPASAEHLQSILLDIEALDRRENELRSYLIETLKKPAIYTRVFTHDLIQRAPELLLSGMGRPSAESQEILQGFSRRVSEVPGPQSLRHIYHFNSARYPDFFPAMSNDLLDQMAQRRVPPEPDLFVLNDCQECMETITLHFDLLQRIESTLAANPVSLAIPVLRPRDIALIFLLLACVLFIPTGLRLWRVWRQRDYLSIGLLAHTRELREHLHYQRSQSRTTGAELSLAKISTSRGKTQSLEARPLSVPGLAAELRKYLTDISTAFSGKVIICIDELDKIASVADLDSMLGAIKGALGAPGSHFIFTIAEEVLSQHGVERSGQGGIQDSTFEEVIFLDEVDIEIAEYIACQTVRANHEFHDLMRTSAPLFWIFGRGIPREIKRCALVVKDYLDDQENASPVDIWRHLFQQRLHDKRRSVAIHGTESLLTLDFIGVLDKIDAIYTQGRAPAQIAVSALQIITNFCEQRSDYGQRTTEEMIYSRAALELALAVTSVLWLSDSKPRLDGRAMLELERIHRHMGTNLAYAESRSRLYWTLVPELPDDLRERLRAPRSLTSHRTKFTDVPVLSDLFRLLRAPRN